ncbi:HIT family protein [Pseudomonas sp. BN411]|uniref:HIT family protein n=1 Tax=Pseudomonas sp. BN411 TaxID=2567887 RepID=UPI002455E5E5|nr:HIT family protein [Pseudomonas sp. BN411]MDH4564211.1 HIT family protein [Pseudomonas sp. BN411]
MEIPADLIVHQTDHWILNHRLDSALPGYLMLGSRARVEAFHELPDEALLELGPLMARTQRVMERLLEPCRLYIGRYGHVPGWPIHFHCIPVYGWVEELFWRDERYRLLETFAGGEPQTATDGAELTLFVWREFCERPDPPAIQGPGRGEVIERLRAAFL